MRTLYPNIYIDESGNTGSDINNPEQKFFVLASVCFSEVELAQIKKDINYPKELHFINMKKSVEGRKAIKRFLAHPLMDKNHLTYQFVDKKFCIYAQITDMLIEPVFHYVLRENLYRNRGNIIMANCLYTFAENYENKILLDLFKTSFVSMLREQTEDSINEFYGFVSSIKESVTNGFEDILSLIEQSRNILSYCLVEDKTYCLDTTITSLLTLINHWYGIFNQNIVVTTDDSKQISAKRDLIRKLCEIKDEKLVGYDTRKNVFPLPIEDLRMVASQDSFGVQLADMVASVVAFRWNETSQKFQKFQDEIKTFAFFQLPCYPLTPSTKEDLTRTVDSSNDIDPIDYLINNLS